MDTTPIPAPTPQPRPRLLEAFSARLNVAMLVANAVGIGVFLWAASHAWADPREVAQGIPPAAGAAFVWFLYIWPVLTAFFLLNFTWVVITLARQQWRNAVPFLVVVALWLAALVGDNLQH